MHGLKAMGTGTGCMMMEKRKLRGNFISTIKKTTLVKEPIVRQCGKPVKAANGVIATYRIANYIEKPNAVRAVARAIGKNHIGYLIPCHSVIAKSGAMSGYRWGIERKKILIAYESTHKENAVEVRDATAEDVPSLCALIKSLAPKNKERGHDLSVMLSHDSK